MPPRVLVTTTSFIDSPGVHLDRLRDTGFEVVQARGPFSEKELLVLVADGRQFDGFLCGEDHFTSAVLTAAKPRAKVISKYGVGLDRIDIECARSLDIAVHNTPGVNHHTVTEHTFGLLLSLVRRIPEENNFVHRGEWRRLTGRELIGKTLAVIGFGRVGREVAKRALAFGMNVVVYNTSWPQSHADYVAQLESLYSHPLFEESPVTVRRIVDEQEIFGCADFISLHMNLTKSNTSFFNRKRLAQCKRGAYLVNVSRGALIDEEALVQNLRSGHIAGYGADVLEVEPIAENSPLKGLPNVILTPHIGSRTYESVIRQGLAALDNLTRGLQSAGV